MNWSGPNVIHFGRKSRFGPDQFILVVTISFWSWPNHYGQVQINLVRPKPFWTDQNCFGHIERQGIRNLQEQVKKVLCFKNWPELSLFELIVPVISKNFQTSASNFKKKSRSLEQFFLRDGQNNFGNKIPFLSCSCWFLNPIFFQLSFLLFTCIRCEKPPVKS